MASQAAALPLDIELALRAGVDDTTFLELLLGAYREPVVRFLHRMVMERAVAEELAQEAFLRVYIARARFEPTAKFTTWMYRIATNLALNWLRDHRHERIHERLDAVPLRGRGLQITEGRPSLEQRLHQEAISQAVRKAVAELPDRQRAAVLMHKFEEMSYGEIAQALSCSVSAIKSLLFRAYTTLRGRLRPVVAA